MKYELKVYSMYELGARSNQEDCLYPLPQDLTCAARNFVLCDGMGGHDSGEVASDAVCRAMGTCADSCNDGTSLFTADDFRVALNKAYDALDERDTQAAKKMGTTMTFLAFHAGGCLVAHIGDSRVYHLRPGQGILYETRDHSLVNDLIKVGELTEETAKDFPQKNVITRVMQPNQERRSRADIKEITDVRPGDYFFMCSDGVNETMESCNIANVLLNGKQSDADKMRIIKDVTQSSRDNHTAFLIRVESVKDEVKQQCEPMVVGGSVANNENLHTVRNDKKRPDGNSPKQPFNKKLLTIISVAAICIIAAIFGIKSCNDRKAAEAEALRATAIAEQHRIAAERHRLEAEQLRQEQERLAKEFAEKAEQERIAKEAAEKKRKEEEERKHQEAADRLAAEKKRKEEEERKSQEAARRNNGTINGHEYVDLGLSVKWGTCNVGASTPGDYGNYYAWGETTTKNDYSSNTSTTNGKQMNSIAGNSSYDVARKAWGSSWRMPTTGEFQELIDNCTWTWTTQNGHNGYKVTSKKNGNSIFLPAAGWRHGSSSNGQGTRGYYWSATPNESNTGSAYDLYFYDGSRNVGWYGRHGGHSVRPVSD